jgi:hypothetical protein
MIIERFRIENPNNFTISTRRNQTYENSNDQSRGNASKYRNPHYYPQIINKIGCHIQVLLYKGYLVTTADCIDDTFYHTYKVNSNNFLKVYDSFKDRIFEKLKYIHYILKINYKPIPSKTEIDIIMIDLIESIIRCRQKDRKSHDYKNEQLFKRFTSEREIIIRNGNNLNSWTKDKENSKAYKDESEKQQEIQKIVTNHYKALDFYIYIKNILNSYVIDKLSIQKNNFSGGSIKKKKMVLVKPKLMNKFSTVKIISQNIKKSTIYKKKTPTGIKTTTTGIKKPPIGIKTTTTGIKKTPTRINKTTGIKKTPTRINKTTGIKKTLSGIKKVTVK